MDPEWRKLSSKDRKAARRALLTGRPPLDPGLWPFVAKMSPRLSREALRFAVLLGGVLAVAILMVVLIGQQQTVPQALWWTFWSVGLVVAVASVVVAIRCRRLTQLLTEGR